MKKLLFLSALFLISCVDRSQYKINNIRIVFDNGRCDTIRISYYQILQIWNTDLIDSDGSTFAQGVDYYSILDSTTIK